MKSYKPKMKKKISNFINSTVNHIMNGLAIVDQQTSNSRLEICKKCVEYFDAEKCVCNKCGCFLLIKTTWASERCPIGKWTAITDSSKPCNCSGEKNG